MDNFMVWRFNKFIEHVCDLFYALLRWIWSLNGVLVYAAPSLLSPISFILYGDLVSTDKCGCNGGLIQFLLACGWIAAVIITVLMATDGYLAARHWEDASQKKKIFMLFARVYVIEALLIISYAVYMWI